MLNWVYRRLFRLGDILFQVYCYLIRPTRRGAYVVVWWDNRVLLIENSYRNALTLPSGGIANHEDPYDGARRELSEEVGIVVDHSKIQLLSRFFLDHDNIRDEVYAFELVFREEPEIEIDNREVILARFEELEIAMTLNLSKVAAHILQSYLDKGE